MKTTFFEKHLHSMSLNLQHRLIEKVTEIDEIFLRMFSRVMLQERSVQQPSLPLPAISKAVNLVAQTTNTHRMIDIANIQNEVLSYST